MNYPNLFKSRYPVLKGRDWVRNIDPDDRRVFVDIGLQAAEHGRAGGRGLYAKRGSSHMQKIGYRGAVSGNIKRAIIKAAREALLEGGSHDR